MNMSDQAVGAVMMALQKSLLEQTDIVPVLKGFEFVSATQEEGAEAQQHGLWLLLWRRAHSPQV